MRQFSRLLLLGAVAVAVAGCDTGPKGSAGFTLPDGDVDQGKIEYINFGCNACHDNNQVPHLKSEESAVTAVILGGETTHIKTYGELVTSIINPSHKVARRHSADMADEQGQSKMTAVNDVMTVTQLINLVAFVQSSYELTPYKNSNYPIYWVPERKGDSQ